MDELDCSLPIAGLQRLRRLDDILLLALWWSDERLLLGLIQSSPEIAAQIPLTLVHLVVGLSHQGHLHQHGGDQVSALEEVGIDVHVEGELLRAFELLLFRCEWVVSLRSQPLREQLLVALVLEQLVEVHLRVLEQTLAESAQTELGDGSVVEDLGGRFRVPEDLTAEGQDHQKDVARGVILVVKCVMVCVAQHGPGADDGGLGAVEVCAELVYEVGGRWRGGV